MPKGNLSAFVNGKQSGSTHFEYSLMLHRHSSDLALLSSVLLLCSQTAPLHVSMTTASNPDLLSSTTSPGGKNEIPSSRISRKVSLHCWSRMVLNRLREAPGRITVGHEMRDAGQLWPRACNQSTHEQGMELTP